MKMKERVFFEEFDSLYYFHGSTHNWAMQDFHFHRQYEIILFLNDGATFEVGKRTYHVREGDLFLLNNKEYHRTIGAPGKTHSRYVLMFDPEILLDAVGVFGYDFPMFFENRSGNFVHKLHLSKGNFEKIKGLLSRIETYGNIRASRPVEVKVKLSILELVVTINEMYEFFIKTQENHTQPDQPIEFKQPVLYRERIEQIKKYIVNHVGERLELEGLAKEFYISRHYLSHYFKKETGFTLVQYITNQKVIAAKTLLKDGHSVSAAAARLGYNSDSHFISVFKRTTGITPKQYAKEKKNKSNE